MNFSTFLKNELESKVSYYSSNNSPQFNKCKHLKKIHTKERKNCLNCGLYLPLNVI